MNTLTTSQLSRENHFRFGYGTLGEYFIGFGACKREPLDFRSECLTAAREIAASTNRKIIVCLSGGLDSELVALSFLYARRNFTAAILRFENDLNVHDISWAVRFCEIHQIPYEMIDFNINSFLQSDDFLNICKESACLAPLIAVQIKLFQMISDRGDFPVTGSSELILKRQAGRWFFFHQELVGALFRYQEKKNLVGQAGFFYWSPELINSFLLDPFIKQMLNDTSDLNVALTSSTRKYDFYRQHFQVSDRPKYRGYEKMAPLNTLYVEQLAKLIPKTAELWIPVETLLNDLTAPKPSASGLTTGI